MYSTDIYCQTFNYKKDLLSNVILFYLATKNSTNSFIWNILLISILMVSKVSVEDESFPHPDIVLFMSTTERTYTPQGPSSADLWLFCPSQTVSDPLTSTGGQLSAQTQHSQSRTQGQTPSSLSSEDNSIIKTILLILFLLELHNWVIFNIFLFAECF